MEEEYNVDIALEIIQLKIAKLLNSKQMLYKNFKEELEMLNEKEGKVYCMDKETINEICKKYLDELKKGGISNE